jgi:RNA polymerase sigma factor (sigma-70 family)
VQKTIGKTTLRLVTGDIAGQDTDAVVTAAHWRLNKGVGTDGTIHSKGGPAIYQECRRIGGYPIGDAVITTGGNLQAFVAFARNRLGDHHLAEDVVQESLIKALTADRHPETDEETTTWFYRILRRSIIDVYRKRGAHSRALERFEQQLPETPGEEDERELCNCFRRLLPLVLPAFVLYMNRFQIKPEERALTSILGDEFKAYCSTVRRWI